MPDKKRTERTEKHTSALDNEIKKALECCVSAKHICPHDCPMLKNKECLESMRKNALDLINRLQAENEQSILNLTSLQNDLTDLQAEKQDLEIELKAMRGAANSYKAENDKLKKAKYIFANVDYCADDLEKVLKENEELKSAINGFRGYEDKIKAEAYKEFAEQLDAEIESSDKYIREYDDSEVQKAYNKGLRDALKVLKELVGDA